mgnify:CR=1 FL=1
MLKESEADIRIATAPLTIGPTKGTISKHNYCSGSCAAIVNNQRYPKYPAKKCRNTACGKMHRRVGSPYCSIECGKKGRFKYTESEIVEIIKAF